MALTKDLTVNKKYFSIGFKDNDYIEKSFDYPKAYIKIDKLTGGKESVLLTVNFYTDSDKAEVIKTQSYTFTPTMTDENFIAQGYNYLKTLDEFKDAIDC